MKRRLHIELKGDSPDLGKPAEGVSLRFFSSYAKRLREAYQRSAQAVLTGTVQDAGRLPARAAQVDIRLITATEGSLNLDLAPSDEARQMSIQPDTLAEDALAQLMEGLQFASDHPDATTIPRAYRALIGTVDATVRQTYQLVENGRVLKSVIVTSTGFDRAPDPVLANVERLPALVKGITFSPRIAVLLEIDGTTVRANATPALVEKAFSLRDRDDLIATIVESSTGHRLLAIAAAAEPFPKREPSADETADRYAAILEILAK